jgi:hypothetical protein
LKTKATGALAIKGGVAPFLRVVVKGQHDPSAAADTHDETGAILPHDQHAVGTFEVGAKPPHVGIRIQVTLLVNSISTPKGGIRLSGMYYSL